jgi:hypothetical protein
VQSSPNLPTIRRSFNQNDALVLTARLVAAFGDHRVADEGLRQLWLYELVEALQGYAPELVNKAAGGVIRKCKFWPTIAELVDGIHAELPRPSLPRFTEKAEPPLTAADLLHRAGVVARARKMYGYNPETEDDKGQWLKDVEAKPFYGFDTKESDVTPALRALLQKQGANHPDRGDNE